MIRRLLIVLMFSLPAFAATHWVSPTGAAAYASCVGASPLSGTSACSLATANSNAVAGDLVYLRAGTYNGGGGTVAFQPSNNGTNAGNRITFSAYTGETVTIVNYQNGFWFSGNSYIRVTGMTFSNVNLHRIDNGSNHNEVDNNLFQHTAGGSRMLITGGVNQNWVTHNWIHNNHFAISGSGCTDGGNDTINIGASQGTWHNIGDNDNNNTIENNFFEHAQHTNFDNYGIFTVFRNNILHNEPWSTPPCTANPFLSTYSSSNPNYTALNGNYGHRNMQITEDYNRTQTFVLVEGNRSGYAGVNQSNDGADDFSLAAPSNIVRYNFFYAAMNPGLIFKYNWNSGLNNGGHGGTYNRVYNNTFYQNGYGYPLGLTTGCGVASSTCPWPETAISLYSHPVDSNPANCGTPSNGCSGLGNVLKNNIFYLSSGFTKYGADVMDKGAPSNGWGELFDAENNWCTGAQTGGSTDYSGHTGCSTSGNPLFTNPDISSFTSKTLPDLSLQATSPAINGGIKLTTATNSGSGSTTLTVADAMYFQDGTWGSDLSRPAAGLGGTMQADWIAIGTVGNTVQIASVTYGSVTAPAGTITLSSPMTWSNGASIWLYKKSDGAVVLSGAAPDYGASEVTGSATLVSITLSPTSATLSNGQTVQLSAACLWSDSTTVCPTLAWNSDAGTIATVNSSGLVSGVAVGVAHITATANSITSNQATITVTGPAGKGQASPFVIVP